MYAMIDKRQILAVILCMLMVSFIWAVPVERRRFMATLVDGSQIMLTSCGDEHLSFFLTDDDMVVELTDSGFALTDYDSESYLALHEPIIRKASRNKVGSYEKAEVGSLGTKHVAVLLAQFQDKPFTVGVDSAAVNLYYQRYCNGTPEKSPYTGHGSSGAVTEYFSDQSNGQLQLVFDVIGPITLDSVYSYYGKDSGSTRDVNYSKFVKESLEKACRIKNEWGHLDNNADGKVDMVVIIYAGLGQNYTNSYGDKNTIWPKEMPASYKINGITFAGCSSTCELRPTGGASGGVITSTRPDGIGVFCHEFSHALGLPDFYDTNYKAFGMDYWSIMDYGQYAVNSFTPVGYTAYERDFMKWQMLQELKEPCTLRIPCFAKGGHGYKIVNDNNTNEYYVLENRQDCGWDRVCRTRGHGLMITHVDYDKNIWTGNRVNTDVNHQCMTIIPANNTLIGDNNQKSVDEWTQSLRGNLYPGTTGNHELTDTSTPASVVFTGGYMGKPIYDIEETADSVIVLKFNPLGTLDEAQELTPMDVTHSEAMLTWEPVAEAEAYNIRITDEFDQLVMQVDSISANNYKVEDLEPNTTYGFSVQAIADKYRNSEWATPVTLITNEDIDGLSSNLSESAQLVRVYNLNGVMVTECKANEICRLRAHSGIYVVKFRSGKTRKMLITE